VKSPKNPKVAIVHSHLVQYGGGEKTVEALLELFPDAPIFTGMYKPEAMSKFINSRKVITPGEGVNKLLTVFPIISKYFTFLLPTTFESFDLSGYDVVISSCSSYAKGVLTKPGQLHIAYIHTPPRFLYKYSVESTKRDFFIYKPVVMLVDHYLRIWDFLAAQRPDILITNSAAVRDRIRKFWRRDAKIIYPPVEIDYAKTSKPANNLEQPYYVALGRFSAYKNFDLVVNGFNLTGMKIKILGSGFQGGALKKMARSNIEFVDQPSDEEKHKILSGALGLIFPVTDEDFGIVPVEAMAHGVPVLAHRSGGPMETVIEGETGMFFDNLNLETFTSKLKEFDSLIHKKHFDKEKIKKHAQKFSKERFQREFMEVFHAGIAGSNHDSK
jgi:glycosyltransferase involved in cell wall biosynthesis